MNSKVGAFVLLLTASLGFAQTPVAQVPELKSNLDLSKHKKTIHQNPKLDSLLSELKQEFQANRAKAQNQGTRRGLLFKEGNKVLVEVRAVRQNLKKTDTAVRSFGLEIRHNNAPGLYEGWIEISRLEALAADGNVLFVGPAKRVDLKIGNSDSQGINESMANTWHTAGFDGTGVTIANIDGGYQGWLARQGTNDWPPNAQLTTVNTNGGAFGTTTPHGTATVEINYDMAPGADFIVYETTTVGDWVTALGDATTAGADIVSVSLGAPLDGVGDGSDCPPGFLTPCGTVAEASTDARNAGVLVVNAAGNERESHWGGLYNDSVGNPGTHDWGGGNVNPSIFCIPNGATLTASLHYDDWTAVNHDYNLLLTEFDDGALTWTVAASSTNLQNGGVAQTPQEFIAYNVAGALGNGTVCPAGSSAFGVVVTRVSAATNRNLQVFTNFDLSTSVAARSLGFPADSPSVMTVAAIDVTTLAQESYSSEGPVLGPGGSLAASTIDKPNIAAYANVDTEAYGAGIFNGTSAATPHVAGAAALVLDAFPSYAGNPDAIQGFLETCALDLGPVGWDTQFGHGELNLCNGTFDVWTRDNTSDNGTEPHSMSNIWHSPDIKICQTQNCPTSVQPEFGQTNWIYVTMRNTGPGATAPIVPASGTLHLYYSNMGGSAQWPADWTLIDSVDVTLDGGEVRDIEVEWTNVPAVGHYCMLSRWVSADDPMAVAEIAQTTTNVRNNNNISWKNFNVVDLLMNIIGNSEFTMRNFEKEPRLAELVLRFPNREDEIFIREGGLINIAMPPEVAERFRQGGKLVNIEQVDDLTLRLVGNEARLMLPMDGLREANLDILFEAREPFPLREKAVRFNMEVIQMDEGRDVGGVAIQINARGLETDTDEDGIPDYRDKDDDNDGVPDAQDQNPLNAKIKKTAKRTFDIDFQSGRHNLDLQAGVQLLQQSDSGQLAFGVDFDPNLYEAAQVSITYADQVYGTNMEITGNRIAMPLALVEAGALQVNRDGLRQERSMKKAMAVPTAGSMAVYTIGNGVMTVKTPGQTQTFENQDLYDLEAHQGQLTFSFNGALNGKQGAGIAKAEIVLIPKQ